MAKLPAFSGYLSDASSDTSSADARRSGVCRILDIGTGAGFPAIPLKIAFPQLKITMIDSLQKRIKFLNEVISQLELTDIEALHGRAEDYAHNAAHREQYDFVVSRAVANLSTLSEYCLPYVKVNGYFVSYKSIDAISGADMSFILLPSKYALQRAVGATHASRVLYRTVLSCFSCH